VFDISPHFKLGEMSPCLARRLGINDDPNNGGVDTQEIHLSFLAWRASKHRRQAV
jgi:hypothetical protein